MIKIHTYQFRSNNPGLRIEDVIYDIKAGINENGIVNIYLKTRDKYCDVFTNSSIHGPDFNGKVINISPIIYDEVDDVLLNECNGIGYDRYLKHPDFFVVSLVVDYDSVGGERFVPITIPLKHEYFISLIPHELAMNYDCLDEVELIEHQ